MIGFVTGLIEQVCVGCLSLVSTPSLLSFLCVTPLITIPLFLFSGHMAMEGRLQALEP